MSSIAAYVVIAGLVLLIVATVVRDLANRRETGNFIESLGCLLIALVVVLSLIIGAIFGT